MGVPLSDEPMRESSDGCGAEGGVRARAAEQAAKHREARTLDLQGVVASHVVVTCGPGLRPGMKRDPTAPALALVAPSRSAMAHAGLEKEPWPIRHWHSTPFEHRQASSDHTALFCFRVSTAPPATKAKAHSRRHALWTATPTP
jgi:hypothetical protein